MSLTTYGKERAKTPLKLTLQNKPSDTNKRKLSLIVMSLLNRCNSNPVNGVLAKTKITIKTLLIKLVLQPLSLLKSLQHLFLVDSPSPTPLRPLIYFS